MYTANFRGVASLRLDCLKMDSIVLKTLNLAVYSIQCFWQNAAFAKSSTSLNAMFICIKIVTFGNTPIQIHTNLFKNKFPQNTLHAKYKTFTVFYNKVPITEESNIVLKLPAFYIIQNNWMLKGHAMS